MNKMTILRSLILIALLALAGCYREAPEPNYDSVYDATDESNTVLESLTQDPAKLDSLMNSEWMHKQAILHCFRLREHGFVLVTKGSCSEIFKRVGI